MVLIACTIVALAGLAILVSNNVAQLILMVEYVNFLIFPTLVYLATATNNPYNLLLIIPTSVFSAVEIILASVVVFYNVKN